MLMDIRTPTLHPMSSPSSSLKAAPQSSPRPSIKLVRPVGPALARGPQPDEREGNADIDEGDSEDEKSRLKADWLCKWADCQVAFVDHLHTGESHKMFRRPRQKSADARMK